MFCSIKFWCSLYLLCACCVDTTRLYGDEVSKRKKIAFENFDSNIQLIIILTRSLY